MWSIVEYLKKPELVVAVQEWFGVQYINNKEKNFESTFYDTAKVQQNIDYSLDTNCVKKQQRLNHQRNDSNVSTTSFSNSAEDDACGDGKCSKNIEKRYRITNRFWYYLFIIGTELGDELFYATMIPFWFWNIDGAVGRRVVFVWSVVMYVGQGLKDIIRWPRPGPPVQRLQNKWSIEYGMPSTHAMVAVAMPFSVVIFMLDRYVNSYLIF